MPPPYGDLWDDIERLLDKAVKRGGDDWGDVCDRLSGGEAQLWLAVDEGPVAAMVTCIEANTLEIWLAGGAVLSGCVPFLETTIEASKAAGTTNGRVVGRKGWERVLAPYGWRRDGKHLVKEWAHGRRHDHQS